MITSGERSRHEQILTRHVHRPAIAKSHQSRFQDGKAFIKRKNAFDLFVSENESHGCCDYDFTGLSSVKVSTAALRGNNAIAVSAVGKP